MSVKYIVDQLSLPNETKNVLFVIRSFFRYLLIFSFIPILFAIGLGFYFYKKEKAKSDSYSGTITFIETDKINTSGSSIGAAQFPGLQIRSQGQDVATSLQGVIRSDKILSDALFSPVSETNEESLINMYFRLYFPDKFENIKVTNYNLDSLSSEQIAHFNKIKNNINDEKDNLLTYDSENILMLTIKSKNQELSYAFVNNLYNSLSDFFSKTTSQTYNRTLHEMEHSRDSTFNVLKAYEKQLAYVEEGQNFRVLPTERIPNINLVEKIMLTKEQYYRMFQEVEAYKIRNKVNQSIFTKLSSPLLPLPKESPDAFTKGLIGASVGTFLGLFLLFLFYIIRIIFSLYKKIDEES